MLFMQENIVRVPPHAARLLHAVLQREEESLHEDAKDKDCDQPQERLIRDDLYLGQWQWFFLDFRNRFFHYNDYSNSKSYTSKYDFEHLSATYESALYKLIERWSECIVDYISTTTRWEDDEYSTWYAKLIYNFDKELSADLKDMGIFSWHCWLEK